MHVDIVSEDPHEGEQKFMNGRVVPRLCKDGTNWLGQLSPILGLLAELSQMF